jgi:hypothetical protein
LTYCHRIMPPGMFHEAFTPVRTICSGGHFYNYHTMHLTEMGRAFAALYALSTTNASHAAVNLTLHRMVCAIPSLEKETGRFDSLSLGVTY